VSELLRVEDLAFSYGKKQVFRDVTFSVPEGQIVCLMGPNGCGKTTLLDCIMAVHRPERGSITLLGRPLSAYRRHEIAREIAYVPQIHDIYFPYTVREMVLLGRTAYTGLFGEPKEEDEEISLAAMRRVGVDRFADQPYSRLSGGEIKLVLLARALGQQTRLIVMDEPTAHLDYRNELIFLETLASLVLDDRISVLMATHSPEHAYYFAGLGVDTRAALFRGGTIFAYGEPEEVITEPALEQVYGVKARIVTDVDENGRRIRSISLRRTV